MKSGRTLQKNNLELNIGQNKIRMKGWVNFRVQKTIKDRNMHLECKQIAQSRPKTVKQTVKYEQNV